MPSYYYGGHVEGHHTMDPVRIFRADGKYRVVFANGEFSKGFDTLHDAAEWADEIRFGKEKAGNAEDHKQQEV